MNESRKAGAPDAEQCRRRRKRTDGHDTAQSHAALLRGVGDLLYELADEIEKQQAGEQGS